MVRFCGFGGRRTACLRKAQREVESTAPSRPQHQSQSQRSTATPHPLYPSKDPVAIVQKVGLDSARVWMCTEILVPHHDSIPGPSSTYQVAVPTELSRSPPHNVYRLFIILTSFCRTLCYQKNTFSELTVCSTFSKDGDDSSWLTLQSERDLWQFNNKV